MFERDGEGPRYFGVYPALVTKMYGDQKGRVEVKFPWLGADGDAVRALATLCTPYADDDQGLEIWPAEGTQVIVAFEAGNLYRPYIIGSCWNGKEKFPETAAQANNKRVLKTREGSLLEFDDSQNQAKVTLKLKTGSELVLDDSASTVTLKHKGGSSITFESSGNITITTSGTLTVNASAIQLNCPSSTSTGAVTCTTFTATSVTSPLYSQGAGNIW
jgi:uncharacterized protein involved in type VI secretion and phage assembly